MESAEGKAVVILDAAIRHVQRGKRGGEALAKVFAECEIESGVLRQVIAGIRLAGKSIAEAGSVVDVSGSVGAAGE